MRKFAATSVMLIAALGVAAGTANADPAPAPAGINVSYKVDDQGKSIALTVGNGGSLAIEDGKLEIKNADGVVMGGTPLSARVDDFVFPIAANVQGDTATLAPQIDVDHATYKPVALPYEDQAPWKSDYDREQAAWNRMKDTIGLATTAASLISGVIGGVVGCGLGAVFGAAVTLPVVLGGGAGPVIGCLLGAAAGASAIGIAGTVFIAVPVAIAAIIQYMQTVNEPHIGK
ncbi:hypothetical protein [Nocardia sp. NPDC020380]|uniref:hypothetical protein n=1 Tax=Nocardia sp. NPDC020380 TaxID=3364309 RepID=UPI0037B17016